MRRSSVVGLVSLSLLIGGLIPAAGVTPSGLGSADIPVHGTFTYRHFGKASGMHVLGAVHGVQRIDGGTVVYYSVGVPAASGETGLGSVAFSPSFSPYKPNDASQVLLVDSVGLTAYQPLKDDQETAFMSTSIGFEAPAGDLMVAFAVFPELPPQVTAVDVQLEWGVAVAGVPVLDGAFEPVTAEKHAILGEGWPALPTAAQITAVNPAPFTFDLRSRVEDVDGATATEETLEQVDVNLDADFFFDPGSAKLSSKAQARLKKVATDIAARARGEVNVTGHTDSRPGVNMDNQTLSEKRAQAVVKVLKPLVGDGVTLKAVGKGEDEPVADNSTDDGRSKNRRVTLTYQVQEER